MFDLRTLGTVELRAGDGREVRSVLAQPKRVALLVYLACARPGGFHRRDTVVGMLWPESSQTAARHSLNQSLYMLRRSLGADALVSRGKEEICLAAGALRCDAADFRGALEAGRMAEALELYRGDLLEGFFLADAPEFERWLEIERRMLRERAARAACELAERCAREDGASAAGHWARRAADLAAADEEILRRAMLVLLRIGDRLGARERYEAFRRILGEDVELSAETRELEALLLEPPAAPVDFEREAAEPRTGRPADRDTAESIGEPAEAAAAPRPEVIERAWSPIRGAPVRTGPFIGREEELERLADLLGRPECRLVTVAGPPGAGKTRLALEAAFQIAHRFGDGAAFVSLASTEPHTLEAALAAALAAPAGGTGRAEDALVDYLRDRETLLLLDDFDHLVERTQRIATLLAAAPELKLLVTSREALNLRAEWLLRLEGLAHPPAGAPEQELAGIAEEELRGEEMPDVSYPALRLFLECAHRAGAPLRNTRDERAAMVRICQLAEGLPLAIEMAAAWTRVLPCGEIAAEIEKSRRFLAARLRDVPERHASLWAAFAHSWGLLAAPQREALGRLSVFRGSFTREAAERVADSSLPTLATLVDRSLLHRQPGGRYSMLESLKEFAAEKLAEVPRTEEEVRDRHSGHFLALLRDHGPGLAGRAQEDALAGLTAELEDIRAAWRWAIERGRYADVGRAAHALHLFLDLCGWQVEAEATFREAALRLNESAAAAESDEKREPLDMVMGLLLCRQGAACLRLGLYEQAEEALRRGLEKCRLSDEVEDAAFALDRLAVACYNLGRFQEASELEREALSLRRAAGDLRGVATSLNNLGSLAYALGDHAEAERLCSEALKVQRETGDAAGAAVSLQNLGHVALVAGDHARALRCFERSLVEARLAGALVPLARALYNLGNLANSMGDRVEARGRLREALTITREAGLTSMTLEILAGLANSLLLGGETERAVELLALVRRHPAAEATTRDTAGRLLEEASARIPAGAVEMAVRRGEARRLAEMVELA